MKRWFVVVKLLFIWGCGQPDHYHVEQEPYPSKDSILQLADEVMEYVIQKENIKQSALDSLSSSLLNTKKLSSEQIIEMSRELRRSKRENLSYEKELDDYKTKRVVTVDSVIYDIDTIKKNHYITDTLYDTVTIYYVDTIKRKKRKRR